MFEEQSLKAFSKILRILPFAQRIRTLTVHIGHFLPVGELDHVESVLEEEWGYQSSDEE